MASRRAQFVTVVILSVLLISCGGLLDRLPKPVITFADLNGATALAVAHSTTARAVDDEETPHNVLYKMLTDGSWTIVEFQNERGRWTEFPVSLLHLVRLNDHYFVLVFGSRDTPNEIWQSPHEEWSDSFLLDAISGNMYYLNAIANLGGGDMAPVYEVEGSLGIDDADHVYYLASPFSSDNFANEGTDIRERSGVVQLTINPETSELTGEFVTSDATWVYEFVVSRRGDIVYRLGTDGGGPTNIAYRTSDGSVGFLSDYLPWEPWELRLIQGEDGRLYLYEANWSGDPADPASEVNETTLHALEFVSGEPAATSVTTLFASADGPASIAEAIVADGYMLFVANGAIAQYFYDGNSVRIEYPIDVAAANSIVKSDRYVYILNGYDPALVQNETTFALLVDLELQTVLEYPLDRQRYQVNEFRDYPSSPDAVYARMTDVLTGTTASYALNPDGSSELLSEEAEETLIITIEPL